MKKGFIAFGLSVLLFFMVCLFVITPPIFAQGVPSTNITAQPLPGSAPVSQLIPKQADFYQNLSPAQKETVRLELGKSGGRLTPEAVEALKAHPDFQGLTPEDVAGGRQLLEQKGNAADRKSLGKKPVSGQDKIMVSGTLREKTLYERSRNFGKYQDISIDLHPFGYEFFNEASVRVLTDRKDIPVPLKYVIGAGDEVKLLLWGRINAQYNLTVDRDGKITIPQIGPVFVAGMTFEDMSKQIIKHSEQVVGTNVDISMGSLKTIPVFVLGDVRRPGAYTIGSFATITDALLMAGGPTEIGSMRNVQLKRKGQTVTTFDLYDLLLKGDKSKDVTLMAGDVVFVPVTGAMVGFAGNIKRPAIYELRNQTDLQSAIDLAGGIIPTAYTQQIQVERIIKNDRHVVLDIDDKNMERAANVKLQDADLVKIFSIVDMNVNAVYLRGNVKRPGKYEIKTGMKLGDLIKDVNDLLPETYFEYALIKRLMPPAMETVLIPFSLKNLLKKDEASNIDLMPQDQVFVFNRWFFKDRPIVTIEGKIRGDCNFEQGAMQDQKSSDPAVLVDLRNMQDELKKQGMFGLAGTVREISEGIKNYGRAPADNMRSARDELIKQGRPDLAERIRDIENKMKVSCTIDLSGNMRIKDVILAAGGLTNDSYLGKGEIIRSDKFREYTTLYFDVTAALEGHPEHNLTVQGEDRIVIHSIWEQTYKKQVVIDGDVAKPGSYQYTDGMTVRDLVFKGGNIQESAYVDEAEISSIVIERGRKTSKTVRRVINLRKALDGDPADNLALNPYDRLFVKRIPDWGAMKFVTVAGEFKFPGRYAVHKGEKLSSLLMRAGGYATGAYLRGVVFTRQSVKEIQQQGLEETARRMEKDLMVEGTASISRSLTAEEIRGKEIEMLQKQKFIETLKTLKAKGRMTIRLANLRLLTGSEYDIELEDGDNLYMPPRNNVVNVLGAVMAQTSYIYLDQFGYEDYIHMAGGYASYANSSAVYVLKVDGSARRLGRGFLNWSNHHNRWETAAFGETIKEIEPGDVIVVPEKFEKIAWLREIRDITQILMNTAVVAATVIRLF